jgi:RNA polymerase-binding transcription factor DksA
MKGRGIDCKIPVIKGGAAFSGASPMSRYRIITALLLVFFLSAGTVPLNAYTARYKEQFYRLYHLHYIQYPDDTIENIYWLEKAAKADFANPLYALALIEDKEQWEKYRYLFMMHINLKLIEQYLFLGNKWNKRNAYFYNAPWKETNLEALETAEQCFRTALVYWTDAVEYAHKSLEKRFRFINLERVQFWEDEAARIEEKKLDYEKTINRELGLLRQVREKFEAMDENTY